MSTRNPLCLGFSSRCVLTTVFALAAFSSTTAEQVFEDKPLIRDYMGINAHTVQFDPALYAPVCRLVRDFHPVGWDLQGDPSNPTTFPKTLSEIQWEDKSGMFRDWSGLVDWDQIYGAWAEHGFVIDVCLMFGEMTIDKWPDPKANAYAYGKAFATYFGPTHGNGLVSSLEIGNEPAGRDKFSDEDYMTLFRAMARGIREGDPALPILTCTAEAEGDGWSKNLDIFAQTPGDDEWYDVINVHKYALKQGWPTWERTFPEDPRTGYLGKLQDTVDWRDKHAPDKAIWITEFGFDASTQTPDPDGPMKDWIDSSDKHQAQWIVRSFLTIAALDYERAYLYWFNDNDSPSFHAASGITRMHEPKPSYWAMKHLYETLGDYRLSRVVEAVEGQQYIYEFTHGEDTTQGVWVAWSPTGDGREATIKRDLPGKLIKADRMPMTEHTADALSNVLSSEGMTEFTITESPIYLWWVRE